MTARAGETRHVHFEIPKRRECIWMDSYIPATPKQNRGQIKSQRPAQPAPEATSRDYFLLIASLDH